MDKIERIQTKIEKIKILFVEVMNELNELKQEAEEDRSKKMPKDNVSLPTEEECRMEYDRLFQEYLSGNPQAVKKFVAEKPKNYLKIFSKANNLSVDAQKASKERITKEIIQWLAQRKAITGALYTH